jgi:hypothetical protein
MAPKASRRHSAKAAKLFIPYPQNDPYFFTPSGAAVNLSAKKSLSKGKVCFNFSVSRQSHS